MQIFFTLLTHSQSFVVNYLLIIIFSIDLVKRRNLKKLQNERKKETKKEKKRNEMKMMKDGRK